MGKGDKKTKRGKIIIGSFGIKRKRNQKRTVKPATVKAEQKPAVDAEEQAILAAKAAAKKAAKKAEEAAAPVAEEKPKAAKAKKKGADGEVSSEASHEEPAQE